MDLFKLKVFIEIAETGNLTQASNNLNISQPAMSTQLKSLEEFLGYSLFFRNPKGMILTPQGELLLNDAQKIIDSTIAFNKKANSLSETNFDTISIGLNTDSSILQVNELLNYVNSEKQEMIINFVQTKSEDFESDITSGKINAGFFYGNCRHQDIEVMRLKIVPIYVILPEKWAENCEFPRDIEKLSRYSWIWTNKNCPFSQSVTTYLTNQNITSKKIFFIDDEALIGTLVENEVACSFLAEPIASMHAQNKRISIFPLPDITVNLNFGYRKSLYKKPYVKKIVDAIKEIWEIEAL